MKKIIIIGSAHPYRGGIAMFNESLAKAFQKEGEEVVIETFTLQYPNFLFPGKTQYANWTAPDDIKINRSINSVNPFNWIKLGLKLKRQKPDLVIFGYWLPFMAPSFGIIGRIIRRNKHTKNIALVHNMIPHEKFIGSTLLSKFFIKSIDSFVAMSKSVIQDIKNFNNTKPTAYSPHPLYDNYGEKVGRETAIEKLKFNKDDKHILFFGLIRDYKGLDLLLQAFANEQIAAKNIKLIIAGEFYSNKEKYIALINNLNLKNRIILHDHFIPEPEVGLYFGAADIIAQPYKNATQSGVTQIGYHFEKPMLVTNVGGLSEIIPDQKVGYVVEPNPEEIAKGLLNFFENNRSDEFFNNLLLEKKKYEWSEMTNTILTQYKQLK